VTWPWCSRSCFESFSIYPIHVNAKLVSLDLQGPKEPQGPLVLPVPLEFLEPLEPWEHHAKAPDIYDGGSSALGHLISQGITEITVKFM